MPESTPVALHAASISCVSQAGLEARQQTQGCHPGLAGATPALGLAGAAQCLGSPPDRDQTQTNAAEIVLYFYFFMCNCQGRGQVTGSL